MLNDLLKFLETDATVKRLLDKSREYAQVYLLAKQRQKGCDEMGEVATLEDEATAEITGITEGNAPGARGHVDCMEIVKDNAIARAIPIVTVRNPLAKVTHETAIGKRRQATDGNPHGTWTHP